MLEDYFALQLKVAGRYATAADIAFDVAITRCSNLRRRFHLWGPAGEARWNGFLAQVRGSANDHGAVLAICCELYAARCRTEVQQSFGCFSYDAPDAAGVLRIHFTPPENTRTSPLACANISARMAELRALFSHVRQTERSATAVRGISWLYKLNAYRRLFPASYAACVSAPAFPVQLNGSSTWGQVLNWRQEVKPAVREAVLARLPCLKIDAPWEIFSYQALVATGDVNAFYALYLSPGPLLLKR